MSHRFPPAHLPHYHEPRVTLQAKRGQNATQVMKPGKCANCGHQEMLCPISKFCLSCDYLMTHDLAAFQAAHQKATPPKAKPTPGRLW